MITPTLQRIRSVSQLKASMLMQTRSPLPHQYSPCTFPFVSQAPCTWGWLGPSGSLCNEHRTHALCMLHAKSACVLQVQPTGRTPHDHRLTQKGRKGRRGGQRTNRTQLSRRLPAAPSMHLLQPPALPPSARLAETTPAQPEAPASPAALWRQHTIRQHT